jgi:hypothetical protein
MPLLYGLLHSGVSFAALKFLPARTPIFANRSISAVSDGTVGSEFQDEIQDVKNSVEVLCSAGFSGLMKSMAGGAFGAGRPRNAESGCAL